MYMYILSGAFLGASVYSIDALTSNRCGTQYTVLLLKPTR